MDQGSRVQYIQSKCKFSFPGRRLHRIPLCIFKEKTLPENVVAAKSAANSYADNTPRDNSPPSLHHHLISLAPLLCSLSFFFLSIFLPTQYENIFWISTKRGRLEGEGGAFRS